VRHVSAAAMHTFLVVSCKAAPGVKHLPPRQHLMLPCSMSLGCRALLEQALQHGSLQEVAALAGDAQLQEYCNAVVGLVQVRGPTTPVAAAEWTAQSSCHVWTTACVSHHNSLQLEVDGC
jgi:hypothetical protein